jgi:hypothetical protein
VLQPLLQAVVIRPQINWSEEHRPRPAAALLGQLVEAPQG